VRSSGGGGQVDRRPQNESRATASLRRTPGSRAPLVSNPPELRRPAIKPLGPPYECPRSFQMTAAINSYNEHYCAGYPRPAVAKLSATAPRVLAVNTQLQLLAEKGGAGESGSIGGTQRALALGHCHTGVGRCGPAPLGRGKRPQRALATFMARVVLCFYAE
jgi:hypothetical protein